MGMDLFCQIKVGLQDGGLVVSMVGQTRQDQLMRSWYKENVGNGHILTHPLQKATKWTRRCPMDNAPREVDESLAAYLVAAARQDITTFCTNIFENQTDWGDTMVHLAYCRIDANNVGVVTLQGQPTQIKGPEAQGNSQSASNEPATTLSMSDFSIRTAPK